MRRYFITQHPTFGSYAKPIRSKIETSPYFFWWLALTHNSDYIELCNNPSANRFKTNNDILKVYKDFGDVRYEGDKDIAFTKWWRGKVNDTETRGEYLFAEPTTINKVMLIEDRDTSIQSADDESSLLIRVPTNLKRNYINSGIERIFAKHITFERGRQTRNPSRSNARYHLSAPIMVETYKTAFGIYEHLLNNKLSSFQVAKKFNMLPNFEDKDERDIAYERRVVSTKISRKKKEAKDAISNVAKGIFP